MQIVMSSFRMRLEMKKSSKVDMKFLFSNSSSGHIGALPNFVQNSNLQWLLDFEWVVQFLCDLGLCLSTKSCHILLKYRCAIKKGDCMSFKYRRPILESKARTCTFLGVDKLSPKAQTIYNLINP